MGEKSIFGSEKFSSALSGGGCKLSFSPTFRFEIIKEIRIVEASTHIKRVMVSWRVFLEKLVLHKLLNFGNLRVEMEYS